MKDTIKYREATSSDKDNIARLHALSWKTHYRGLCPDHYLDEVVDMDRKEVWTKRFDQENSDQVIHVAEHNNQLCAFVCTFLSFHEDHGSYLDNLHVHSDFQGFGIGRALMTLTARAVQERSEDDTIYLHVLEKNLPAIHFYEKIGGKLIDSYEQELPWGGKGRVLDYLWHVDQLK